MIPSALISSSDFDSGALVGSPLARTRSIPYSASAYMKMRQSSSSKYYLVVKPKVFRSFVSLTVSKKLT